MKMVFHCYILLYIAPLFHMYFQIMNSLKSVKIVADLFAMKPTIGL